MELVQFCAANIMLEMTKKPKKAEDERNSKSWADFHLINSLKNEPI